MNEHRNFEKNLYDEIIVLGNSFKKKIPLYGIVVENNLIIPEVFKIGTLKSGKEYKFQIPL